jgi:hypothetical protein
MLVDGLELRDDRCSESGIVWDAERGEGNEDFVSQRVERG